MSKGFAALYRKAAKSSAYQSERARLAFSGQVCEALAAQGVSRAELARRIGVAPAYVTKLLRGNVNVTLDTIVKVSAALGLVCEVRLVGGKAPAYNQVAKAAFKGPGADRVSDGGRLHA